LLSESQYNFQANTAGPNGPRCADGVNGTQNYSTGHRRTAMHTLDAYTVPSTENMYELICHAKPIFALKF